MLTSAIGLCSAPVDQGCGVMLHTWDTSLLTTIQQVGPEGCLITPHPVTIYLPATVYLSRLNHRARNVCNLQLLIHCLPPVLVHHSHDKIITSIQIHVYVKNWRSSCPRPQEENYALLQVRRRCQYGTDQQ